MSLLHPLFSASHGPNIERYPPPLLPTPSLSLPPPHSLSAKAVGVGLAVTGAWLSAAAGVYTEYLMKRNDDSIFWQNLQLYG